ncbi:hypothetical protein [Paenibacillus puerhi]|uniref:hypothetical protein n=1 Tax=Paenibacillus puerhi TaxID=2692622 RepID=UPI00135CA94E|nr:hypothetical protein [Paenibacillus puerhi]
MSQIDRKELSKLLLVLAGIIFVLITIVVFSVYSLQSLSFIHIRISSIYSMFAFIGLILLAAGFLSMVGTMLESLRRHLLKERFELAATTVQELLLISFFGAMIHGIDLWIEGVEIGNPQTEVAFTLFVYLLLNLLGKLGEQVKQQDAEKITRRPS